MYLLPPVFPYRVFYGCAFVAASAGIVFFDIKRRWSLPSFVLSLSLVFAGSIHFEQQSFLCSPVVPRYRVMELVVDVVSDSRIMKNGKEISEFEVRKYGGIDTEELFHSRRLTALIQGRKRLYKGEVLSLQFGKYMKGKSPFLFINEKDITRLAWSSTFYRIRGDILDALYNKIGQLNHTARILFTAFFLGKKDPPSDSLFQGFIQAGGAHLLARSGMHLGILSGGVILLLHPFFGKKRSFVFSLFLLAGYLFLTGISPSLLRAYIFLCFLSAGMATGVKPDYFHLLSLTFILHCIIDPLSAYTLSFKLSYLALTGIFLFAKPLYRILPGLIPPPVRAVLAASGAAQAGTLPVSLYSFHVFYPAGFVSSVVLLPLVTAFLLAGIVFLVVPSGPLFFIIRSFVNFLGNLLSFSVHLFQKIPFLSLDGTYTAVLFLTLVSLGGYLFFAGMKKRGKWSV